MKTSWLVVLQGIGVLAGCGAQGVVVGESDGSLVTERDGFTVESRADDGRVTSVLSDANDGTVRATLEWTLEGQGITWQVDSSDQGQIDLPDPPALAEADEMLRTLFGLREAAPVPESLPDGEAAPYVSCAAWFGCDDFSIGGMSCRACTSVYDDCGTITTSWCDRQYDIRLD